MKPGFGVCGLKLKSSGFSMQGSIMTCAGVSRGRVVCSRPARGAAAATTKNTVDGSSVAPETTRRARCAPPCSPPGAEASTAAALTAVPPAL